MVIDCLQQLSVKCENNNRQDDCVIDHDGGSVFGKRHDGDIAHAESDAGDQCGADVWDEHQ